MKTSVIRQRVADFLKRHAPFDTLQEEDLLELAGSGKVKFHESEEYLYRQGDPKGTFLWTIQQGRVELLEENGSGERLRDIRGEGDLLGLERFAGDGCCLYSARTATDVILYGVAASVFEATAARYPEVQRFLAAHFSVSGHLGFQRASWLEAEAPPLEFLRSRLVTLPADVSLGGAAPRVAASRNGVAALIDEGGRPIGTVTPRDLCLAVDGDARGVSNPCSKIVKAPLSTRGAVRELLRKGGDHLAITSDGTAGSPLEAILTGAELALFCGYDPAGLVRGIRAAGSEAEIAPLLARATATVENALAQPHDVDDCRRIGVEVVAALADACIRLADAEIRQAGVEVPAFPHCWVMFGAAGRGDILRPQLPTIAAVYDDGGGDSQVEDSPYCSAMAEETAARFQRLGLCGGGFSWPHGARPGMPISQWKRLYSETIQNPLEHDLYARRGFFDLRALRGDAAILRQLQEHILLELRGHEAAIALLANDTMAHLPPLTFFGGLVLAMDGTEQDSFDIEEVVVSPLANAARVFALAKQRLSPVDTLSRLETALADFPEGAAALRQAADAFRIGLYYQTVAGGVHLDSGKLGKFDQQLLKTAFSSIQQFLEFTVTTFIGI